MAPPHLRVGECACRRRSEAEVRRWLDPRAPDGLKNAGSVFAVFPHNYDLQNAMQKFRDDGRGPSGRHM